MANKAADKRVSPELTLCTLAEAARIMGVGRTAALCYEKRAFEKIKKAIYDDPELGQSVDDCLDETKPWKGCK
jgi:hypothetical protein